MEVTVTQFKKNIMEYVGQLRTDCPLNAPDLKFFYLFRTELINVGYTPDDAAFLALSAKINLRSLIDEDDDFIGELAVALAEKYAIVLDQLKAMNLQKYVTNTVVYDKFLRHLTI